MVCAESSWPVFCPKSQPGEGLEVVFGLDLVRGVANLITDFATQAQFGKPYEEGIELLAELRQFFHLGELDVVFCDYEVEQIRSFSKESIDFTEDLWVLAGMVSESNEDIAGAQAVIRLPQGSKVARIELCELFEWWLDLSI